MPRLSEDGLDDLLYFYQASALADAFGRALDPMPDKATTSAFGAEVNLNVVAAWWLLVYPDGVSKMSKRLPREAQQQMAESNWQELLQVNLSWTWEYVLRVYLSCASSVIWSRQHVQSRLQE